MALTLATKFYEYYYFTVAEIHEMSNHEFTNKGTSYVNSVRHSLDGGAHVIDVGFQPVRLAP